MLLRCVPLSMPMMRRQVLIYDSYETRLQTVRAVVNFLTPHVMVLFTGIRRPRHKILYSLSMQQCHSVCVRSKTYAPSTQRAHATCKRSLIQRSQARSQYLTKRGQFSETETSCKLNATDIARWRVVCGQCFSQWSQRRPPVSLPPTISALRYWNSLLIERHGLSVLLAMLCAVQLTCSIRTCVHMYSRLVLSHFKCALTCAPHSFAASFSPGGWNNRATSPVFLATWRCGTGCSSGGIQGGGGRCRHSNYPVVRFDHYQIILFLTVYI